MAQANPVNAPSDFPVEFPVDDLQVVIDYFRGNATADLRQFAASVQAVVGFALGQLLQRPAMQSAAACCDEHEDDVASLESLLAQANGAQAGTDGFRAIDWKAFASQVLQTMLPLILKWLAS